MTKEFEKIRGKKAETRCKILAEEGFSPMYCDCGCQTPRDGDNLYNLKGVTVNTDCDLLRDGKIVGEVTPQVDFVLLDGTEYIKVQPHSPLYELIIAARKQIDTAPEPAANEAGSVPAETAASEAAAADTRDDRYCPKCGTICYGDCEAN